MKSRKHKKKDDRHNSDEDDSQHRPLKLVLKFGSSSNDIAIVKKKKKSKKHKLKRRSSHSKSPTPSPSSSSSHDPRGTKPCNDGDLTAEQIIASVKQASDRLKRPINTHLSYLHQENDGTTKLKVIGSEDCTEQKDKTVTLGSLVGQLPDGISSLPPYKEPEGDRVNLGNPVDTEPFSSFLPSVDSSGATLSEQETQLLRDTYGDEKGYEFIKSIVTFAKDSDYALDEVDELLEKITEGEHSKTMSMMKDFQITTNEEEKEKEKEQKIDENKNEDENKNKNENECNNEKQPAREPYNIVVSDISSDEDLLTF